MATARWLRRPWDHPGLVGGLIALVAALSAARATDFQAPPRFDGAGYAVLAEAVATGRGYREIDHPDAPRHAHFPPGYPSALAGLWQVTGRSQAAAHGLSLVCTVLATLAAWRWFATMYRPATAALLGLALAANWTWQRNGGAIQSEPLYLFLSQVALLGTLSVARRGGVGRAVALGALLASCVLTRHVGVALVAAVELELLARRRVPAALAAGLSCALLLTPWAAWLASVRENTQAALVGKAEGNLARLVASQAVFYAQRMPDQVAGPIVEIATVYGRSGAVAAVANSWAALAGVAVVFGWIHALRNPRRRLASLVAFCTLALLLIWPFTEAGRFLVPLVPCLLVGATEGLAAAARLVRVRPRRSRVVAAWLLLAVSVPYSVYGLATDRAGAQRRGHDDFDAACAWIARSAEAPGPVLTRHPGEVYWQSGRQALSPTSNDPEAVRSAIERYGVAYLLVDEERYSNAPPSPLGRFVEDHPERVLEVWSRRAGRSTIKVYAVVPAQPPERPDGSLQGRGPSKLSRP